MPVRLVMSGVNAGGNGWSTGLWTLTNNGIDATQLGAWVATLQPQIWPTFNGGGTGAWGYLASSGTRLTDLKAYYHPTFQAKATAVGETTASGITGAGADAVPYTCAVVASLRTALSGRSYRGRMYCPADGAGLTGHQFADADCAHIANGIHALFGVVNSSSLGGSNPLVCVGSRKMNFGTIVTSVEVDSLPDVQRRREDKVAARYREFVSVP